MKTNYLLPNKYKKLGWGLFLLGIALHIFNSFSFINDIFFDMKVLSLFYSKSFFKVIEDNTLNETIAILIIIGGFLIGFSKEKIEDEFIHKLRYESFVWAIIANYIILLFCIVFIYGEDFLTVMMYNMFTPLLFFIIRFNFLKLRSRSHEE